MNEIVILLKTLNVILILSFVLGVIGTGAIIFYVIQFFKEQNERVKELRKRHITF